MAYLGKGLKSVETANISVDTMTGNGSATTMSISLGSKTSISVNDISVFVSGVMQRPGTDYTLSGSTITFTTAPENGWKVVALSKGDTWTNEVMDGSVTSESIKDGAVTDAKLTGLSASKLTGNLPAIDGSALTGVETYTKSATDPTISTNPSGGVGTVWVNQVSGEMYICTDATAGANIWANVGGGSGNIQPFTYQGTQYGYSIGGHDQAGPWTAIQRFSIASDGNGTDQGDVAHAIRDSASLVSETHGYVCGSESGSKTDILKIAYASDSSSTAAGNLSSAYTGFADCGSSSGTHGYIAAGAAASLLQSVDKYSFANEGTATTPFNLTEAKNMGSGHTDSTGQKGYYAGGFTNNNPQVYTDKIEEFSFASDSNATALGDLTQQTAMMTSSSSTTHGYLAGGSKHPSQSNQFSIQKIAFGSSSNSTDLGDLDSSNIPNPQNGASASSTTHGYHSGGSGGAPVGNQISKYSYAGSANSTDVGDMVYYTIVAAGNHV